MGGLVVEHILSGVLDWFAKTVLGVLEVLWDLLSSTVFVSPDVTVLPQVTTFAGTSLGVVNTAYVLAFLWVAILVMGRGTIQAQYGPGDLIPRLIIGLIGANFAIPLCSTIIQLANAVTAALTGQDITAPGSMRRLRDTTAAALTNQNGASPASFLLLLIALIIAVLVAMLVVQWIIRLGVLIVAVGIAPIALALHGTPQTEGAAKLWWRTILGTLGTVVIQAVALHTTLTIFFSPEANLPALGMPGDPGATMNLLVVTCLLWGVIKIPALMRRYVTQGRPSTAGMIARVVVVQQFTRGLGNGARFGRGPSRAAAAASGARASSGWPTR